MEVVKSEKPVKDRGNKVTSVISGRLTEDTNNSDDCGEESVGKTAKLHNGGEQVVTSEDSVGDPKSKKKESGNTKHTDAQDSEYASNSDEKWQLQLDLSDSASTSDNDGSEVEASERNGENMKRGGNKSPVNCSDAEDSEDFIGFEMNTALLQGSAVVLTKLIGLAESALKCGRKDPYGASTSQDFEELEISMEDNDMERKLTSYSTGSSSKVFIDCDNEMNVDDCEGMKFSLKLISDADDIRIKDEPMDEDSSSRDTDIMGSGGEVNRRSQLSHSFMKTKEENKIGSGDDRGSEARKKRRKKAKKKYKELQEEDEVASLTDTNSKMLREMSVDVSSSAHVAVPLKTDSVSGVFTASEEVSSEVTSSAASSPSASSRSSVKISASGGRYIRGDSPALSSSGGKGKKVFVDLSNPAYLKPFEYGWKRELVYRNANESSMKKMADIYYYTPTGKKARSNREVMESLEESGDLTIENFTFCKEALGINDPTKEIIRDAKKILSKDPSISPVKKTAKPKSTTGKSSPSPEPLVSSPVSQSEKGQQQGRTVPPKTFPKIKKLQIGKGSGAKQKNNESSEDGDLEIGMLPPMWNPSDSPFLKTAAGTSQAVTTLSWSAKSVSGKKSNNEPCSIRCVGVMGLIPSLQCRVCLCLYHPECVGLGTISETIHSYVCKNCQQELKDGKPSSTTKQGNTSSPKLAISTTPPPLTPISALGAGNKTSPSDTTVGQSAATPSSPPKLQRLPRMGESGKLITVPRFVKVPRNRESVLPSQQGQKGTTGNKGTIVGSVTTWLPPSSTIQLSPSGVAKTSSNVVSTSLSNSVSSTGTTSDPLASPPNPSSVQSVACVGGKKYIVVPKHNVLSVSPAMAATATTPTSKPSVLAGDLSPLGDKAPVTLASSLVLTNTTGRTTSVFGGTPGLIGQPQVLMPSSSANGGQTFSVVQGTSPLTNFVTTGGPVLPQSSAYIVSSGVSGGLQNPPGVLLVPFMGSGSTFIPTSSTATSGQDGLANKNSQQQQPQYLIVNGPPGFQPGNFIIGNLQQSLKPTDSPEKMGDSADGMMDGHVRDSEDISKGKHKLAGHESDGPAAKHSKSSVPEANTLETERHFMQYFMMNVCAGYSSLLHVFQYLKVQELLRAARVCRMWHDMASHPSLWRTVRMKNSHVGDWDGLVKSLRRHETQHLDLRKMLVPNEDTHSMWDEFCHAIVHATSLSRLDLCRCPARVVERVAESCPQLKIINALSIKCSNINLQSVENHKNLQELRLKSLSGIHLSTTLVALKQLSSLKHLSLTTFKELGKMEPNVLGSLKNLESLELGECCDFPPEFGPDSLSRLKKLERLRLEKGQGKDCPTFSILAGIAVLPKLTHLELVNFDVKPGFDKALAQCTNIRRLLIIPTYVTQSATTNHMVLNGVNHLCNSLTHFVWGVTHELLRVTELFVDQCEGQKDNKAPPSKTGKKSSGSDSIPILKPIQIKDDCETEKLNDQENELESNRNGETKAAEDCEDKDEASAAAPQVEILPLPKLQKLLTSSLPKTKVKILKIPFHATWRQTISEPAP
ncbi:uncharacterized protein LOC110829490 isoform X2 [Zootermopsis nevadensis]|uniref:uncharacterized protein LOC110829490 isoform X2 n=1 Tax=Zootermopsis nevadensis TaxID=136037 RepID=UPI000B8E8369|nr:uncharacterized protein LOC110829490 isoform X2 [Zootermopsis nevadensis]